jgi:ABC-type Fe3+-siderophore transport system permease subunit
MSVHQLAERAPEIVRDAGAGFAGITGIISFVGDNASFFTVCFAFIGALVAVAGHLWKKRIDRERREEERLLFEARMAALRTEAE